jgi:putative transposase
MKPSRLISPPGTYFVTFSTFQRRRFFVVESYARLFLKTLYGYRRQGRFALHAFVLMLDHVHLLLTPARDPTLERAMQLIKGGYSHAVGVEISCREIWQKGFTDHRIRDAQDFAGHRLYIHQNPVMGKLVQSAAEYRYSSAFPGFKLDAWPSAAEAPVCLGA